MKDTKLIMISGCQGSGKTTLVDQLEKCLPNTGRTKFAKAIYEMHDAVLTIMRSYGFNITLDKRLLQLLGTEWGRNHVNNDVWLMCLTSAVEKLKAEGKEYILVDDLRFKNEFSGFECIKIRLECSEEIRKNRCSQWRNLTTHPSEIDLDDWVNKFDLVIDTGVVTETETLDQAVNFIASLQ